MSGDNFWVAGQLSLGSTAWALYNQLLLCFWNSAIPRTLEIAKHRLRREKSIPSPSAYLDQLSAGAKIRIAVVACLKSRQQEADSLRHTSSGLLSHNRSRPTKILLPVGCN